MGQYQVTNRVVELTAAGGAAPTLRCWAAPSGAAVKDVDIFLSSRGVITAVGNLTFTVLWGGNWSGGTPFALTSTHAGGIIQTGPTNIAGGTEIVQRIHTYTGFIPPNLPAVPAAVGGFPIVVELTNAKAAAVTVYVTFVTRTVSDM
jgi:hypothetical protein